MDRTVSTLFDLNHEVLPGVPAKLEITLNEFSPDVLYTPPGQTEFERYYGLTIVADGPCGQVELIDYKGGTEGDCLTNATAAILSTWPEVGVERASQAASFLVSRFTSAFRGGGFLYRRQ